jgi:hypothetical protein
MGARFTTPLSLPARPGALFSVSGRLIVADLAALVAALPAGVLGVADFLPELPDFVLSGVLAVFVPVGRLADDVFALCEPVDLGAGLALTGRLFDELRCPLLDEAIVLFLTPSSAIRGVNHAQNITSERLMQWPSRNGDECNIQQPGGCLC